MVYLLYIFVLFVLCTHTREIGPVQISPQQTYLWISLKIKICDEVFERYSEHLYTVLIFLGRGTGVSAVPAGVPLVSSAAC